MKTLHLSMIIGMGIALTVIGNSNLSFAQEVIDFCGACKTFHIPDSPLQQFKSGIPISNIQCAQDLSLVIRAEDGTPACIKQDSISKLILRGWISTTPSLDQNNSIFGDFYQGIENDSGIVSVKNQTYYMMTATNTTYPVASGMTVKFHQVSFSFPYGAWATPGGVIIPFDMTFPDGTTETYGKVTKNPDGSGSGSGIGLGPGPSSNRTVTVQSIHTHPQAGVTMTEDQIKLLVSTDVNTTSTQTSEHTTLPASFIPCNNSYPLNNAGFPVNEKGIPLLYMPRNSVGKICVNYYNILHSGDVQLQIYNMTGIASIAPEITISASQNTISEGTGNVTVVYTIKTGNYSGLYGWNAFCVPLPFAVGYDNASKITRADLTWNPDTSYYCPAGFYDFNVIGLSGIGFTMIP